MAHCRRYEMVLADSVQPEAGAPNVTDAGPASRSCG